MKRIVWRWGILYSSFLKMISDRAPIPELSYSFPGMQNYGVLNWHHRPHSLKLALVNKG